MVKRQETVRIPAKSIEKSRDLDWDADMGLGLGMGSSAVGCQFPSAMFRDDLNA